MGSDPLNQSQQTDRGIRCRTWQKISSIGGNHFGHSPFQILKCPQVVSDPSGIKQDQCLNTISPIDVEILYGNPRSYLDPA